MLLSIEETPVSCNTLWFRLLFGFSKKVGKWRLATANWTHTGHPISKEFYENYPENSRLDKEQIRNLQELTTNVHMRPKILANIAQNATGMTLT